AVPARPARFVAGTGGLCASGQDDDARPAGARLVAATGAADVQLERLLVHGFPFHFWSIEGKRHRARNKPRRQSRFSVKMDFELSAALADLHPLAQAPPLSKIAWNQSVAGRAPEPGAPPGGPHKTGEGG